MVFYFWLKKWREDTFGIEAGYGLKVSADSCAYIIRAYFDPLKSDDLTRDKISARFLLSEL